MQCPEQSWLTIVRQNKPIDIHCEILMLPDDVHGTRPEVLLSLYHDCEEIMKAIAFDKKKLSLGTARSTELSCLP
jgi:hypothetical protein